MIPKKSILITGASSGFGLLTTILMVRQGHSVIAGIRGGEERFRSIAKTQDEGDLLLHAFEKGELHIVDLHTDKKETFTPAKELIQKKFEGKLDVLINNAGYALMGPGVELTEEKLRRQMDVNFFGPIFLYQYLFDELKEAKGRIINVSSIVGRVGFPFYSAYNASKFAMEGYFEALSYELKKFDIDICMVEPGGFKTEFSNALDFSEKSISDDSLYQKEVKKFKQQVVSKTNQFADNPIKVARLLLKLVNKEKIPLRAIVGRDAKVLWVMYRILPFSVFRKIQQWFFNVFFLNPNA